jgi:hypothetical protein
MTLGMAATRSFYLARQQGAAQGDVQQPDDPTADDPDSDRAEDIREYYFTANPVGTLRSPEPCNPHHTNCQKKSKSFQL